MQSKTVHKHLPVPFKLPRTLPHRHHQLPTVRVYAQQPPSSGSYDSEGDELLREFQQYTNPNKLQKITERLELTWSVHRVRGSQYISLRRCPAAPRLHASVCALLQRRQPAPCDCCDGSGQKECTWCRGTGAASLERPVIFPVCPSPNSPSALSVGAMMVGEELFCSLAHGCKQCPICNSKVRSNFLGFCSHLSTWLHALYLLLVLLVSDAVHAVLHSRKQQLC